MKTTNCTASAPLNSAIDAALNEMVIVGYGDSYIKQFKCKFEMLKKYCAKRSISIYSASVGEQFFKDVVKNSSMARLTSQDTYKRAVRRLNCAVKNEKWFPFRLKCKSYASSCFDEIVSEYDAYLLKSGKSISDTRHTAHEVARFLGKIEKAGCADLKALNAATVYQALINSKASAFNKRLKPFLKYAFTYKLTKWDFSVVVPEVRRNSSVPTVYSPIEVEEIIGSIDHSSINGKRKYAITIIAARLGLRASDIAALTFQNIDFANSTINLIQSKTKVPLTLPLREDVKNALLDYINNERPNTTYEHVFINQRGYGVMQSNTVSDTISSVFRQSGIDLGRRKHGSHALRSSLATALLSEGNDYNTIQKVLGQSSIQVTKAYARADAEELRVCALPVSSPTGRFESLLCGKD